MAGRSTVPRMQRRAKVILRCCSIVTLCVVWRARAQRGGLKCACAAMALIDFGTCKGAAGLDHSVRLIRSVRTKVTHSYSAHTPFPFVY